MSFTVVAFLFGAEDAVVVLGLLLKPGAETLIAYMVKRVVQV